MIYEGLYYIFVMNWLCNYPSQNVMIINSEEMFHHTPSVMKQVFDFLGLKSMDDEGLSSITSYISNKTLRNLPSNSRQLSGKDKKRLLDVYEPFNRQLLELLSWEDVPWSKK